MHDPSSRSLIDNLYQGDKYRPTCLYVVCLARHKINTFLICTKLDFNRKIYSTILLIYYELHMTNNYTYIVHTKYCKQQEDKRPWDTHKKNDLFSNTKCTQLCMNYENKTCSSFFYQSILLEVFIKHGTNFQVDVLRFLNVSIVQIGQWIIFRDV